jgi:hypothetical protein
MNQLRGLVLVLLGLALQPAWADRSSEYPPLPGESGPVTLGPYLQNVRLQAGMPAEVFIRTDSRTALDYLLAPVTSYLRRAMREPV